MCKYGVLAFSLFGKQLKNVKRGWTVIDKIFGCCGFNSENVMCRPHTDTCPFWGLFNVKRIGHRHVVFSCLPQTKKNLSMRDIPSALELELKESLQIQFL